MSIDKPILRNKENGQLYTITISSIESIPACAFDSLVTGNSENELAFTSHFYIQSLIKLFCRGYRQIEVTLSE